MANPSCFVDAEAPPGGFYCTKRDVSIFFDTLRLPDELRPFTGQPPVRVRELMCVGGMSLADVRSCAADTVGENLSLDMMLAPAHTCWPMKFS